MFYLKKYAITWSLDVLKPWCKWILLGSFFTCWGLSVYLNGGLGRIHTLGASVAFSAGTAIVSTFGWLMLFHLGFREAVLLPEADFEADKHSLKIITWGCTLITALSVGHLLIKYLVPR